MEDATSEYLQALKKISVSVFFGLLWTYRWIWASPPGNAPEKRALCVVVSGAVRCQLRAVAAVAVRSAAWPCKAEGGESAVRECGESAERARRPRGERRFREAAERRLGGDQALAGRGAARGAGSAGFAMALCRCSHCSLCSSWILEIRCLPAGPRQSVYKHAPNLRGRGGGWGRLSALRIFKRPPVRLIHDIVVVGAFGAERP